MLAKRTISGVIWSFAEQLLSRGVGILVTLLLAKFLVPEDFGLLAMITVFIAIASSLMDSGIRQAVIRKLDPDEVFFSTAFYSNIVLGIVAYLFLYFIAPTIANFYEEPRLVSLIRVSGLVVLINSFQVIQTALLSRSLNFRFQMQAAVPAAIISGSVAVFLAYIGWGVWALVFQTLINAFLVVLFFWAKQPWRPIAAFSVDSLKEMYKFGYKLFLSGLLETISKNIYVIVIAKLFSATIAGLYFFAERIKDLVIGQFVTSVQKVTYPALSRVQTDNLKLKEGYRRVMQVTTFMLFPVMLLMAALAKPLFEVFLPGRWAPAVPYLQLMCIASVLYPVHSINLNILKVKGRSDLFLALEIYKKVMIFFILYLSYQYGVEGILVGRVIQSVLAYIPNSYFSVKLINYSVTEQMSDLLPNFYLAATVSLVVYGICSVWDGYSIIELLVLGSGGLVFYILFSKVLNLAAYSFLRTLLKNNVNTQ